MKKKKKRSWFSKDHKQDTTENVKENSTQTQKVEEGVERKVEQNVEQKVEQKVGNNVNDGQKVEEQQNNSNTSTANETNKGTTTISLGIDRSTMSDADYIKALEVLAAKKSEEAKSCVSLTQRIQADFENYRRRNQTIAEDNKLLGQSKVIEKLLVVLDNCDLARKYVKDQSALTGFNMMEDQIITVLAKFGLEEVIVDTGTEFDPNMMSAVERERNQELDNKVIEVLSKGYILNGKLLRPASVKVGYFEENI